MQTSKSIYQLSEMKAFWLDQVLNTRQAFRLPANSPLSSRSLQELRHTAIKPYAFEHDVGTHRLATMTSFSLTPSAEPSVIAEPDYQVHLVELLPGGRWVVTVSASESADWFWLMVWDVECAQAPEQSASPVATYPISTGTPIYARPYWLFIQPIDAAENRSLMCFVLSTIEDFMDLE